MSHFQPFRCVECGADVHLVSGPGRTAEYRRGLALAIPDSFAVPTCSSCGEMYFTVDLSERLAKLQAPLYDAAVREHVIDLVDTLQQRHSVRLRDIERACAVTPTYISHVTKGRKKASQTLVRLLEAFVKAPLEFMRQVESRPWSASNLAVDALRDPGPSGTVWSGAPQEFGQARAEYVGSTFDVVPSNDTIAA